MIQRSSASRKTARLTPVRLAFGCQRSAAGTPVRRVTAAPAAQAGDLAGRHSRAVRGVPLLDGGYYPFVSSRPELEWDVGVENREWDLMAGMMLEGIAILPAALGTRVTYNPRAKLLLTNSGASECTKGANIYSASSSAF